MFAFSKMEVLIVSKEQANAANHEYDHDSQALIEPISRNPAHFGTMFNSGTTYGSWYTGYPVQSTDVGVRPMWEDDNSRGG